MKRRLFVILLSGVFSFSFAPSTNGCDLYHAGPLIITLPWQIGQFLHLELVLT